MTPHPSTCQCGGSGRIAVHPIYPLKMTNECPGMPETPEEFAALEKRIDDILNACGTCGKERHQFPDDPESCPCHPLTPTERKYRFCYCNAIKPATTHSQEIVEWEKDFQQMFYNRPLGKSGKEHCDNFISFIRSLLATHSQALQERHEAEIKKLVRSYLDYKEEGRREYSLDEQHAYNRAVFDLLKAFDHATHLNPKS